MELTAAHWVYLAGVVVIIGVMVARKNVVVPAVIATFGTAWVFSGSVTKGLTSTFTSSLTAASELFSIFLIISFITGLLGALRAMGAERRMVRPFQRLVRGGPAAFGVLVAVTFLISLFFWPTPAVPLIGAVLLPAAVRAGLPPLSAAAAIAVSGQGMALSSDYVIQVAPGMSAKAAGVPTGAVADHALVLSLTVGAVALGMLYLRARRGTRPLSSDNQLRWEKGESLTEADSPQQPRKAGRRVSLRRRTDGGRRPGTAAPTTGSEPATAVVGGRPAATGSTTQVLDPLSEPATESPVAAESSADEPAETATQPSPEEEPVRRAKAFAVLVPLAFAALIGYMMLAKFTSLAPEVTGDDAAALVGGVSLLLLFAAALSTDGLNGLTTSAAHVVDGMVFAFKAMGVVIPIAGFFFLGNADFSGQILGTSQAHGPSLLFDLVSAGEPYLPANGFVLSFAMLLIGMITGLEGSGFSGLPLTGSLSGALGPSAHLDPTALAAVGQMGSVWTGGGVLIAWSSLLAVAGIARVPVQQLVRHCFLPVVTGLLVATVVSVVLY